MNCDDERAQQVYGVDLLRPFIITIHNVIYFNESSITSLEGLPHEAHNLR